MRTQLYIDDELRTVDIEDGRITTVNEEPTQPHEQGEDNDANDQKMYDSANYFSDGKIAADVFRAQTIWRKLLRWQVENDAPVTWDNVNFRYAIYYNNFFGEISVASMISAQETFNVYFNTVEKANQALEIFKDDLLWLFTEFKYRLGGGAE